MSPYAVPIEPVQADYEQIGQQVRSVQKVLLRDGKIANWLFNACLCGEDSPVVRARARTGEWEGLRVCKACGLRWEIQLGGDFGACGAVMTEPYGLWLHRQRYSWSLWRWLRADPDRKISVNPSATRHRDVMKPTLDELRLPSWPFYFWCRLMEWAKEPRRRTRRLLAHAKQLLAPARVLIVLHKNVLGGGRVSMEGWAAIVREEADGRIRTVSVHLIGGQWSLHVEEPARAEETAPFPPVSYRAGDDMLELVGLLSGQRDRSSARRWLEDHGYSPPERIGLQRIATVDEAHDSG